MAYEDGEKPVHSEPDEFRRLIRFRSRCMSPGGRKIQIEEIDR